MVIYGIAVLVGFLLSIFYPELYRTYKDLVLLIIATPAAYLVYSFQRRTEFTKTLRDLWLHMVEAVQISVDYTHYESPSAEQYGNVLTKLSTAIDEVRGVFKNIEEKDGRGGRYPFESLKTINRILKGLDRKTAGYEERAMARNRILEEWRELRSRFLLELDRDFPTYPNSPYLIKAE